MSGVFGFVRTLGSLLFGALLLLMACSPRPPDPPPPGHARVAEDQAGLAEPVTLALPSDEEDDHKDDEAAADPDRYPAEPAPGRVIDRAGYKMIRVEPGEFKFGKPENVSEDDAPERQGADDPRGCWFSPATPCTIERPFLLGRTEVTVGLWRAAGLEPEPDETWYVKKKIGACPRPSTNDDIPLSDRLVEFRDHWFIDFMNELSYLEGLEPAYRVDVERVRPYAIRIYWNPKANGYRLPTEAEWEYAARAGQDLLYAGSDDLAEVTTLERRYECRLNGSEYDYTVHPVAQKAPNAWGFYDMSGNVAEAVWRQGAEPEGSGANTCPTPARTSCDDVRRTRYSDTITTRGGSGLTGAWRATVFVWKDDFHGLRLARNAD